MEILLTLLGLLIILRIVGRVSRKSSSYQPRPHKILTEWQEGAIRTRNGWIMPPPVPRPSKPPVPQGSHHA